MKKVIAGLAIVTLAGIGFVLWPTEQEEQAEERVSFESNDNAFEPARPSTSGEKSNNAPDKESKESDESAQASKPAESESEEVEGGSKTAETEIQVLSVEEVDRDDESSNDEQTSRQSQNQSSGNGSSSDPPQKLSPEVIDRLHEIQVTRNRGLPQSMDPVGRGQLQIGPKDLPDPKDLNGEGTEN